MAEGQVQAISSITFDTADRAFDDDGDAMLDADFTKIEASSFIEWGLTERLTLVAQPVVQHVEMRLPGGALDKDTGFAASQIGARWLVAQGDRSVFSAQGGLVVPGEAENAIDAPLGEGGLAAEARLLAGRGWGDERAGMFVDGQLAYRWRTDGDADEARFDATLGVRPSPQWMVLGQSFSVWNAEGGSPLVRDYRSHKAQVSVVRRVSERFSLQLGAFGAYAGQNVVEERAAFAAVWVRLQP